MDDYPIVHQPDMPLARFLAVLTEADSPAAVEGAAMHAAVLRHGISPAVFLAFFHHESGYGRLGICAEYQTRNPGNVRYPWSAESGGTTIETRGGRFAKYPTWERGADDWCRRLLGELYAGAGRTTVRTVLPLYAPASDSNDPDAYARAVLADVERWTMSEFEYPGQGAGTWPAPPKGIILHGSRSGKAGNPLATEFLGTARWAVSNPAGLGWHVTIGPGVYAQHLTMQEWGWHAREHSSQYLGVEFAQPTVNDAITSEQVAAFVAWYRAVVLPAWPHLSADHLLLPAHSEMPAGKRDGKTDPFPVGDARMEDLRQRIYAALAPLDADAAFDAYAAVHGLGPALWAGTYARTWAGEKVSRRGDRVLAFVDGAVQDITGHVLDDWETAFGGTEQAPGDLVRF